MWPQIDVSKSVPVLDRFNLITWSTLRDCYGINLFSLGRSPFSLSNDLGSLYKLHEYKFPIPVLKR